MGDGMHASRRHPGVVGDVPITVESETRPGDIPAAKKSGESAGNSEPKVRRRSKEDILKVLQDFERAGGGQRDGLYVLDHIPLKKRINALVYCGVNQEVLALIDTTMFGSATNCMLITVQGVHFHNGWLTDTPGTFSFQYDEISADQIKVSSAGEVVIAEGASFNCTGSGLNAPEVSGLILALLDASINE